MLLLPPLPPLLFIADVVNSVSAPVVIPLVPAVALALPGKIVAPGQSTGKQHATQRLPESRTRSPSRGSERVAGDSGGVGRSTGGGGGGGDSGSGSGELLGVSVVAVSTPTEAAAASSLRGAGPRLASDNTQGDHPPFE